MAVIPALAGAVLVLALGQHPETLSLLGEPLYAPSLPKAERLKAESQVTSARAAYEKQPNDPGAALAYARATLALGRLGDALEILTHALEANPGEAHLLMARGSGYIKLRKFDIAERDLRKASATLPESYCPLAFALYAAANYQAAMETYARCSDPGVFGYLAARRSGATAGTRPVPRGDAPASPAPIRLPGSTAPKERAPDQPLEGLYLAAIEELLNGRTAPATEQLKKIVEKYRKNDWMSEGYIAAESDYRRLYKPPRRKR